MFAAIVEADVINPRLRHDDSVTPPGGAWRLAGFPGGFRHCDELCRGYLSPLEVEGARVDDLAALPVPPEAAPCAVVQPDDT